MAYAILELLHNNYDNNKKHVGGLLNTVHDIQLPLFCLHYNTSCNMVNILTQTCNNLNTPKYIEVR